MIYTETPATSIMFASDLPASDYWRLASRYFEPCHNRDKGSRNEVLND
jgi:hypothetical protein